MEREREPQPKKEEHTVTFIQEFYDQRDRPLPVVNHPVTQTIERGHALDERAQDDKDIYLEVVE